MKNFISVTLPSRKAKRAVLEKMLRAVNAPLNEKKSNFGIFEGVGKNIILKLEISKQLSESQSDKVAHSLSEGLFGLGYNDFDIEVSTDGTDKQILSDTDWHVNELDTLEAAGAGTEEALMAIVKQYATPGITLANVDAMERAAAGSEPEGDGVIGMFKKFARSKRWRVNYVLAKVSELQGLPGLFNSKLTFCFMATPGDNSGNHISQGGVTSSVGASFGQMLTLAKVGLMPENKLAKLTKAWSYDSKQMIKVKEIISAQQAATSQAVAAPAAKAAVATDTRKGDGSKTDAMTAANQANDRATGKFDNLDEKAATELYFKKLKRLDQLLKANPEARSVSVEESKKLLLKKLHNNYIFEDAAADKEIADLVADIEALSPKVSAPNKRLSQPLLKQAQPYLRRHKSITPPGKVDTTTKVDTTKRDERICAVGNPLAIFAKSGKGGLKNDPDEIAAVIELQKYLGVAPDGKYGSATKSAVTAYQKQHGLKVDSDAGPETIGHMMKQCKAGKPAPYQAPDGSASSGIDGPADAAAAAKAGDKSNTVRRPAISTEASDGVAPADEQTNDKVIKFNWKKNSYYIDVIKVEITPENKIAWTFYRDEGMTNPQKVDILAQYWILRIEKELERRAPASPAAKDALEIIAPITRAPDAIDGSASTGIDGPVVTGKANDTDAGTDAEAPGDAGYYRIPDAMREDLGLDTGKPKYVKLTLSKNGKIFYIYHNPDGTGSGPTIAVDSEEGKKITDFLKDQGAKIIDPSGNTDDNTDAGTDDNTDKKNTGPRLDADDDGLSMKDGMYIFKSKAEFDRKMKQEYKGKVKEGDTVLLGRFKYEEYGVYVTEFGGDESLTLKKGPYKKPVEDPKNNKGSTDTTTVAPDDGSASSGTTIADPKQKTTSKEKENAISKASNLWDQMDNYIDDDEEAYGEILSTVKSKREYILVDNMFKKLEPNDEFETILSLAKKEMSLKQREQNVLVHLRRLKVEHKISMSDYRRGSTVGGVAGMPKDFQDYYDSRTGKYKGQ